MGRPSYDDERNHLQLRGGRGYDRGSMMRGGRDNGDERVGGYYSHP